MKKVLTFLISFILLFLMFDPINLKSEEPNLTLVKNKLEERKYKLKLENVNILDLNKIDLNFLSFSKDNYNYNFKTNTNIEDILNDYVKTADYLNDPLFIKKNGFLIDDITVLDSYQNIKKELGKINFEVLKWMI